MASYNIVRDTGVNNYNKQVQADDYWTYGRVVAGSNKLIVASYPVILDQDTGTGEEQNWGWLIGAWYNAYPTVATANTLGAKLKVNNKNVALYFGTGTNQVAAYCAQRSHTKNAPFTTAGASSKLRVAY